MGNKKPPHPDYVDRGFYNTQKIYALWVVVLGFFVASTTEIFTSPSLFKSMKTVVVGNSTNGVYVNFANKNAMSSFFVNIGECYFP